MLNRKKVPEFPKTDIQGAETQEYCDLCGKHWKGKFYARAKNYQVLLCERCGLIWTNPLRHLAKQLKTSSYWAEEIYLSNADAQRARFRSQLEIFFKKANTSNLESLRVLEVGSGLGFFLDVCEELGIMAEGCDIAERAVSYANRRRERVRLGTLDDHYRNESFDAIFAFNLIEHLTHPESFFVEAKRGLKPGGMLVLETPIQQSLFHRLSRVGYLTSKGRLNFLGVRPGGHIYKFSIKTFRYLCNDMGFRILYQKNINSPFAEIWGKSSIVSFDYRFIYRLSLPIVWTIAKVTKQENRLFVLLQKL